MSAVVRCSTQRYNEFINTFVADVAAGTVMPLNDIYGFPIKTVDISDEDEETFVYKAETVEIGKKTGTGEEIERGEYVYGDPNDNYNVSATKGSGYIYLGIAQETVTASATVVDIEFDGTMADLR